MKKTINVCVLLFLILIGSSTSAQTDSILYQIEMNGIASSSSTSPFWLQNNQYGVVPFNPNSLSFIAKIQKDKSVSTKLFDYNFVSSAYINITSKTSAILHELYLNGRFWVFNASVGMREERYGNQDETLSGGGFLFSNNARPMPKIFVGIEDFTPLFFKNRLIEIKGGVSHGWFTDQIYTQNLLMHHKYGSVRVGGKRSPIHAQYSLDHAAQWGGSIQGVGAQPSGFNDFVDVFFARGGSSASTLFEQINVGGNHIIAQGLKLELTLKDYELNAYWQHLAEDKPIRIMWNSVNVADGLWGVSIKTKKFPFIKKILYEYLNTTDQSGPFHDMDGVVYGGADSYFNNYLYQNGWTHYGRTIGTAFITSPVYNKNKEFQILNNRVQVQHFGIEGEYKHYFFKVLSSFINNYGNYSSYPNETKIKSTNMLFEINKHFENIFHLDAGISVGIDIGEAYSNNVGFSVKISKRGILFPRVKK